MENNFGNSESLDDGFINLGKKAAELLPIIQNYGFKDLATAIFAITSWRDNRSAQESCLALNSVLVKCSSFGTQSIETYEEFSNFFKKIETILKTTHFDDTVTNDFGEVNLCFIGKFYPIITGTGHTGSVYAAVQYLESLSFELEQQAQTQNVLEYSKNMINSLKSFNISQYDDFPIVFDIPTKPFFETVKEYMNSNPTKMLNLETLHTLEYPNQPFVKTHFIRKTDEVFPLFNPSLILDYYIFLLKKTSYESVKKHIHSALYKKIESIHMSLSDQVNDVLIYQSTVAIDQKHTKINGPTFLFAQGRNVVLFIDVDEMDNEAIRQYFNKLVLAHTENRLGFVDLSCSIGENQFLGIRVPDNQPLGIILFNRYTNLDETYMQLGSGDDRLILTAIDLMFLLSMSNNIDEIMDFINYHDEEQAQIFSWGGISDMFSLWKYEKGYISKGAIEYSMIYPDFETSASYVFDLYRQWQECFPFHLTDMQMGFPEQWEITIDENKVYQFARKGMNPQGGAVFLLENGGVIFCSYDFLSIMKDQHTQDVRNWRDLISGLNERFVLEYQSQLSKIDLLQNVYINIHCISLSAIHENSKYAEIVFFKTEPNKVTLRYTVNCRKVMTDISNSSNRKIESQYLLELLRPIFKKYSSSLHFIKEFITNDSIKNKTVNTMLKKLDYYMNPDYMPLRLTDEALLATRKAIAQIAADDGIIPGKYTRKEATSVVRKMQESLVNHFENCITDFERLTLHSILLHHYSSELLASSINNGGYGLADEIDKSLQQKQKNKLITAREENKQMQVSLLYIIETNLFIGSNRGKKVPTTSDIERLLSFSYWLGILQSHSDLCFHTTSDTNFVIMDDYRVNVVLSEEYQTHLDTIKKRTYDSGIYAAKGDATDKEYIEKVTQGFLIDTGFDFRVLESVLKQLMVCNFPEGLDFLEIEPNVIRINKTDAIKDYQNFVVDNVPVEMIQKAYDFLTLSPEKLKTITSKKHNVLPVWERKQRNDRFDVKPLLAVGDSYIYSPVVIKELRNRWVNGWNQFYPPYEIGLDNALRALWDWKERYEHLFSSDIRDAFREKNYVFAEADIDIRRLDRKGNHPTINILGDYDVIALDVESKKLFIIECKVLQPIGSVFEHSMEQTRFFEKEKYDEKFQKRIDYLKENYRTFFGNMGYHIGTEIYEIKSCMVVNKVFDSYYKKIGFPIVTFDELKKMI